MSFYHTAYAILVSTLTAGSDLTNTGGVGNKRGGDGTAFKLKEWLEKFGLSVFMDDQLEGGDNWDMVLNNNLMNAKTMVALCSTKFAQLRKDHEPMPGTSWTRQEV